MALKYLIVAAVVFLLTFNYLQNAQAQDTFGPICDDVTVTCIPTETPTPGGPTDTPTAVTDTPVPGSVTETPTETPTDTPSAIAPSPTELPRAGTTENVNRILVIAMSLIFAGVLTQFVLLPFRNK